MQVYHKFNKLLLGFLLLLSNGLVTTVLSQELNIEHYSVKEGLGQSQINKVYFDSRGFLWLATQGGGLSLFDGIEFTNITESEGLEGNIVKDITEDQDGTVLCASTWGGISKVRNNTVTSLELGDDIALPISFGRDLNGTVWFASNKIGYIKDNKVQIVDSSINQPLASKIDLHTRKDSLVISKQNTLLVFDTKRKKKIHYKTFDFIITACHIQRNGDIWLGTEKKGIYLLKKNDSLVHYSVQNSCFPNPHKDLIINDVEEEFSGKIYFGTNHGLLQFVKGKFVAINLSNGLPSIPIQSICVDDYANVWIGSKGEGLFRIKPSPFSYFSNTKGLNRPDNFAIFEDDKGHVWVGSDENGISVYDGDSTTVFNTKNGLLGNKVRAIAQYGKTYYIGTNQGLNIISNGVISELLAFQGFYIKSLLIDASGNVYVGTIGNGLWIHTAEGDDYQVGTKPNLSVHSLVLNMNNDLLIGTNSGCYQLKKDVFQNISNGLNNLFIGSITQDKNGHIWVGTDRSLAIYKDTSFISYTTADDLTSDLIYLVHSDRDGFLWVGSNKGLDKITLNDSSEMIAIKHYGYSEGFLGIECNSKGVFENKNGEIYFATVDGIHKYMPRNDRKRSASTTVLITDVRMFLKDINLDKYGTEDLNWFNVPSKLSFSHDENHIAFDFVSFDYNYVKHRSYSYILEGFDQNWSPPTNSEYAVYSNLLPGEYTFKVKSCDDEFGDIAEVQIVIQDTPKPFYLTTWFIGLILIIVISVVHYTVSYRNRNLRKLQRILEKKVVARTIQIKKQDEDKTVLLQEIHHRVKNNLQIIISLFRLQSHFTENKEALKLFKNSQNRIRSMSKIHEKLYQSKDLAHIDIQEYLKELVVEIVRSYDLENNVSLEMDIAKCTMGIDQLTPLALIINEIITNTVKYSFSKTIEPVISFALKQTSRGEIKITISNNGEGFDKETIWDNHETMGIELIKTLSEQIHGKIFLSMQPKLQYTLTFNVNKS